MFQLNVLAIDDRFPSQNSSREARVNIRVSRNNYAPRFEQEKFTAAMFYNVAVGYRVTQLTASDDDESGQ